jgi:hypothetical protein
MSFKWETNPRIEIKNTFSNNKVVGTVIIFNDYCVDLLYGAGSLL